MAGGPSIYLDTTAQGGTIVSIRPEPSVVPVQRTREDGAINVDHLPHPSVAMPNISDEALERVGRLLALGREERALRRLDGRL